MDVHGCSPAKKPKTAHTTMYTIFPFTAVEEAVRNGIMVKRQDVYECTLCKTSMTGAPPADSHLKGKGHKRAVQASQMQAAAGQSTLHDTTDFCTDVLAAIKSGQVMSENVGNQIRLTCLICNISCTGHVPMSQHLTSGAHLKRQEPLRPRSYPNEVQDTVVTTSVLPSASQLSQHGYSDVVDAIESGHVISRTVGTVMLLICELCNKTMSGEVPMRQHLASDAHAKQKEKEEMRLRLSSSRDASPTVSTLTPNTSMQYDSAMPASTSSKQGNALAEAEEKGIVVPAEYDKSHLTCTVCNIHCTGPDAMRDHMKGKSHKKEEMRLRLSSSRDASPAVPTHTTNTSMHYDSSLPAGTSSEQGNVLAEAEEKGIVVPAEFDKSHRTCTVCNIHCTGPDAMIEHLKGKNHKKKQSLSPQPPVMRALRRLKTPPLSPASSASARSNVVDYIPPPPQFLDPPEVQETPSQQMKHGERGGNLGGAAKSSTSIFDEIPHGDLIRDIRIYGPKDSLDDLFDE